MSSFIQTDHGWDPQIHVQRTSQSDNTHDNKALASLLQQGETEKQAYTYAKLEFIWGKFLFYTSKKGNQMELGTIILTERKR